MTERVFKSISMIKTKKNRRLRRQRRVLPATGASARVHSRLFAVTSWFPFALAITCSSRDFRHVRATSPAKLRARKYGHFLEQAKERINNTVNRVTTRTVSKLAKGSCQTRSANNAIRSYGVGFFSKVKRPASLRTANLVCYSCLLFKEIKRNEPSQTNKRINKMLDERNATHSAFLLQFLKKCYRQT